MTNRSKSARSAKKSRLGLLDINFEGKEQTTTETLENGKRPHGGYRGSKKHPISTYSFDKDARYHKQLREDIDRLIDEELYESRGSPGWAINTSKEITHSGESPLFVHRLLSPYKAENGYIKGSKALLNHNRTSAPASRCQSARPEEPKFYRPNRTHQYLSATELRDQSTNEVNLRYGRPTRTTLLRARQRSNSAPVNAYEKRRELIKRAEDVRGNSMLNNSREFVTVSPWNGESTHSFLTGARYNRAHLLDSKSLSVYGVYMPRNNPLACFVTGAGAARLRDYTDDIPSAPPDSPRSDIDDFSIPLTPTSPYRTGTSTAKILPSTPTTPSSRPRSAWGDATTTCHIGDDICEEDGRERVLHEFVGGLNVKGSRIYVSFNSNKQGGRPLDTKLPQVKGVAVPRFNKPRDPVEETSLVNQPPPTPIALSARDDRTRQDSMSLRNTSVPKEETKQNSIDDLKENARKDMHSLDDNATFVPAGNPAGSNVYNEDVDQIKKQFDSDFQSRRVLDPKHFDCRIAYPEEHISEWDEEETDGGGFDGANEDKLEDTQTKPVVERQMDGVPLDAIPEENRKSDENKVETDMVLEDTTLDEALEPASVEQTKSEEDGVQFFLTEDKEDQEEVGEITTSNADAIVENSNKENVAQNDSEQPEQTENVRAEIDK